MGTDSDIEKIESYLNREMSTKDERLFLEEVQQNSTLKEKLIKYALASKAIDLSRLEQLRGYFMGVQTSLGTLPDDPFKSKSRLSLLRFLAMAASVIIVIIFCFWWANQKYSDRALAKHFYQIASTANTASPSSEFSNDLLRQGLNAYYLDQNYTAAVALFSNIPSTNEHHLLSSYYLGHCLFRLDRYAEALVHFQRFLDSRALPPFIEKEEVEWNLLLARLNSGAMASDVVEQLKEKIAQPGYSSEYRLRAEQLLDKLESSWRMMVTKTRTSS